MPFSSLTRRSAEPEHLDNPANSERELAALHRQLRRLNRLFRFARPFQLFLPTLLGSQRCQNLELLDIGAGTGELGSEMVAWAAARGWTWRVTCIDLSQHSLGLSRGERRIVGSALALPFADESFDCVIASQMTHHLSMNAEIVQHFREAWRVSRHAVFFSDLYRHPAVYVMVWWAAWMAGCSARLRADAATSVARGFRPAEWEALARDAGIAPCRVSVYFRARILLQAHKEAGKIEMSSALPFEQSNERCV
jgi:2-polyprenyl-3-methyl-5-hydroxy-6-metoxy-1,4-benzoquinol methylase